MFSIVFSSDLDDYDYNEHDNQHCNDEYGTEYDAFAIDIKYTQGFSMKFSSSINRHSNEDFRKFMNDIDNFQTCSLIFNDDSGGSIHFHNNVISFIIYSFKNGQISNLECLIDLSNNENHQRVVNVFQELLNFKINHSRIFRGSESGSEYSDEYQYNEV